MSKIVATGAIIGAKKIYNEAKTVWENAIKEKGGDQKVEFPGTAFYFPIAYALLGLEIKKLSDIEKRIEKYVKKNK